VQTALAQSLATLHSLLSAHLLPELPPQSTSVSSLFLAPSLLVLQFSGWLK
jgi:hypothetical protein